MRVEQLSIDQMSKELSVLPDGYVLLDSAQLEEAVYDEQLSINEFELPVKKSARDLLNEIDPFTTDTMLWEDTIFNEFKTSGPVLSHFYQGSKLPNEVIKRWGNWHVGVLIEADSREDLTQHLRSILMVKMPTDGEVRYRFQETRKLAGILNALSSKDRISKFLGPVKSMYWQQNCGPEKLYMKITNPEVRKPRKTSGWFSFTEDEKIRIQQASLAWFKRSVLNIILEDIQVKNSRTPRLNKYSPQELEKIIDKGYESAIRNNISSQDGVTFYIYTHLLHPEFMNDPVSLEIVKHESWLESRKISTLKAMFAAYQENVVVNTG